jgi:hypothetical protein
MKKPECYKSSYAEKLKDPRWQRKRLEVMNRDNFTCLDCGSTNRHLQVHHCYYEKGEPWDTSSEFLMTLCMDCHESRGSIELDCKRALAKLFRRLPNGGHDKSLHDFASSLIDAASSDPESGEIWAVKDELVIEYNEDARWFCRAADFPAMRKHYEAVTGKKVKWRSYK